MMTLACPTPTFQQIDNVFASMEKDFFNVAGYVPVLGNATGFLRQVLGGAQLIAALAIGILLCLATFLIEDEMQRGQLLARCVFIIDHYGTHGFANIVRGQIEGFLPGSGLLVFGIVDYFFPRWLGYQHEGTS